MKKYLISSILLLCITNKVICQTVTNQGYVGDNGGPVIGDVITITRPNLSNFPQFLAPGSWYANSDADGGLIALPRASYFLEYGDGTYTTFETSNHTYRVAGPQTALLTVRGKYDVIYPHGKITSFPIVPSATNTSATQALLRGGKNINLVSDVKDLIADDMIQVVITFRKTFLNNGKILFYYNSGLTAFKTIDQYNNNQIHPENGTSNLSAIRSYQVAAVPDLTNITPALVSTSTSYHLSTLPAPSMFASINNNPPNSTAANVLVFDVSGITDNSEHNIFITLVTNDANIYRSELASTSINAFIIPDSMTLSLDDIVNKRYFNLQSDSLEFPVAQADPNSTTPNLERPHDPNYIMADKRCTNKCAPNQQPQLYNYRVHFQNDGPAFANTIIVTIFLHKRLNISSFANLSASVAGIPIVGNNLVISNLSMQGDWNRVVYTLTTIRPPDGQVKLFGTRQVSMPETDIRTMGDIRFSIKSDANTQPSYYSIASIVFNNEIPVVTRMNRIRCCKESPALFDPIPPKPIKKTKGVKDKFTPKPVELKKTPKNLKVNG